MHIAESTPAIDRIQMLLKQYRSNESGILLHLHANTDTIFLMEELAPFAVSGDEGVLLVGPRPLLEKGPMRMMLDTQEIDARHLALFGAREYGGGEHALIKARRIQSYSMVEISREGLNEMTDAVMSYVRTWQHFTLIVDLSVVDPAFAPALRNPVPGGLTARELIYVLQRIRLIKSLVRVLFIVDAEADDVTCRLAAHLLAELAP